MMFGTIIKNCFISRPNGIPIYSYNNYVFRSVENVLSPLNNYSLECRKKTFSATADCPKVLSSYLSENDVGILYFMSDFVHKSKERQIEKEKEEKEEKEADILKEKILVKENNLHVKKKPTLEYVFKYRCEDFHVYEIDKEKQVLHLKWLKKKLTCSIDKTGSNETNEKEEREQTEEKKEKENGEKEEKEEKEKDDKELFAKFILYKMNKDTQEALRELSKNSKISLKHLSYAGFKDKRSVSTQTITTPFRYQTELLKLAEFYKKKKVKSLLICNIQKVKKNIELGEHNGNHFLIVLRNVQNNEDLLKKKLKEIKKYGFINYFGMQRFGIYDNTVNKGKALISRNYEKYINLVLDSKIFKKNRNLGNHIKNNVTMYFRKACCIYHKKGAIIAFKYLCDKLKKIILNDNRNIDSKKKLKKETKEDFSFSYKLFHSYMTNSEYEAFVLLRSLSERERKMKKEKKEKQKEHHKNYIDTVKKEEEDITKSNKMCVKQIEMETRRFHMHAYSSKIFNLLTSYRLKNFKMCLETGDYIFIKEKQLGNDDIKNQHCHITVYDEDDISINNNVTSLQGCEKPLSVFQMVLPVLGSLSSRLCYLQVFKKFYRKYKGKKKRLVFLEILLYLLFILHKDNLFQIDNYPFFKNFISTPKKAETEKDVANWVQMKSEDIMNNRIYIKHTLFIIKKFDAYINSYEYEYGMSCVFRNVIVVPNNLFFCFHQYNEPKMKFISDLGLIKCGNYQGGGYTKKSNDKHEGDNSKKNIEHNGSPNNRYKNRNNFVTSCISNDSKKFEYEKKKHGEKNYYEANKNNYEKKKKLYIM